MNLTKKELREQLDEARQDLLRMQTVIANLRLRNGELAVALQELDEDKFNLITPPAPCPSRYALVYELVRDSIRALDNDAYLEGVANKAAAISNFTQDALSNKRTISEEHLEKLQAGRGLRDRKSA